ncbi:uncharacterized protein LOC142013473 isoform X2 [Carettochelys insculpta]|uniref:uncharacterized protein LOC142013473 isoform X2 n=1 Tax=Carettochelys insculpta TaxID=44489 RepID=UPI003EB8483A
MLRPRSSKTSVLKKHPPRRNKAIEHQQRKKCYILTRDSKTVRFDLDEDGHCNISIEDSQSTEDIAWLDIFRSRRAKDHAQPHQKYGKHLVTMTQRSKNNFLLLGKHKKQLYLKVFNPNGKNSPHAVREDEKEEPADGIPDPQELTEKSQENLLFIMHQNDEKSVKFECYRDKNYYLHVNKDSVDICKMDARDPGGGKDFDFMMYDLKQVEDKY